jgi:hypothetical protein
MTHYANRPVNFYGVSLTTKTLGVNDPEPGYRQTVGDEDYVFVYNAGNSIIDKGMGCVASAVTGYSVTVSSVTSADFLMGVAINKSIATAEYGWVCTRGFIQVEMGATSGTVAAGGLLELADDGLFVPVSNTTGNGPVVGKAMEAIVSSASGSAFINVH